MKEHQYTFRVEDVTCEKCDARIQEALQALPGAQHVELVRTPRNEAEVVFVSAEEVNPIAIERAIEQQSVGTTHHYHVLWV